MADAPGDEPSEYEKDKATLQGFLENFQDEDVDGEPVAKYMELLQEVSNRRRRVVEVELVSDGSDASGPGNGMEDMEVLPPLMPGLPPRYVKKGSA